MGISQKTASNQQMTDIIIVFVYLGEVLLFYFILLSFSRSLVVPNYVFFSPVWVKTVITIMISGSDEQKRSN